jgi:hypothetical protein
MISQANKAFRQMRRLNSCDSTLSLVRGFFVNTAITTMTASTSNRSTQPLSELLRQPLSKGSDVSAVHAAALKMIQTQYQKHFHCQLQHSLPYSLSQLAHEDSQASQHSPILACTGYQPAADGALFLEQYLDEPVEDCLQRLTHVTVSREQIVEIGGFAVTNKRHALPFMLQLAPTLVELGFKTVICTVTRPMQRCLRKLGIVSTRVADADPARVDVSNNAWGTYYDLKPVLLAGDIGANIDNIRPLMKLLDRTR